MKIVADIAEYLDEDHEQVHGGEEGDGDVHEETAGVLHYAQHHNLKVRQPVEREGILREMKL